MAAAPCVKRGATRQRKQRRHPWRPSQALVLTFPPPTAAVAALLSPAAVRVAVGSVGRAAAAEKSATGLAEQPPIVVPLLFGSLQRTAGIS